MGSDTSGVLQSDVPISLGVDEPITGKGGLKSGGLKVGAYKAVVYGI